MSPCTSIWMFRKMYMSRYGLSIGQAYDINHQMMWRLEHCADEEARRILLGVSR